MEMIRKIDKNGFFFSRVCETTVDILLFCYNRYKKCDGFDRRETVFQEGNMQPAHNSLALCGLFTALMAVGALIHITVPIGIWQVTLSLQIFVAVLAGFFLGSRQGFLSILAYLVLGLAGLPVFAHGGGLGYLLKPTFGFLLGFPCAAWLTGKLAGKPSGSRGTKRLLAAALGGEMAYYAWGLVYYDVMFNLVLQNTGGIGFVRLLEVWLFSTVIPDSAICMLAVLVYRKLGPLVGR